MKTVVIVILLIVAAVALIAFLSNRKTKQKKLAREKEIAQTEAFLAQHRKAQEALVVESGTPVKYSGGVARPVTSKPSPKPKAKKYADNSQDDTVYGYVTPEPDYTSYTSYDSGYSSGYSSGGSSSSSSDSGYSSGGSSSSSYDSGSSSSSSDSGSSSW